jgi:hypothetical protein
MANAQIGVEPQEAMPTFNAWNAGLKEEEPRLRTLFRRHSPLLQQDGYQVHRLIGDSDVWPAE